MAQEQQKIGINLDEFVVGKKDGSIKVVLVNGVPNYTVRMFDQKTGKPVGALVALSRDAVAKQIDEMAADIDKAKQLLADIDAAKEVMPA
jgi:hypothetical protein